MPVDYSKWDALELSDDSDFEPHPNVDKRSFIRAKQNQIHQQRADRKNQIETLKYERMVNDGLLRRIDTLLSVLRENEAKAKDDPDAFLYQALISSAGDPDQDEAPNPPPGIHTQDKEPIKYSQMMGVLVDQVKKEVDESGKENGFHGYIKGVEGHKKKVTQLQKDLQTKLSELEKEEGRKITSDKLHDGFNSSMVMKSDGNKSVGSSSKKDTTVEVLNPAALRGQELMKEDGAVSSGAEADVDEAGGPLADEESAEVTALGKRFLKIKYGDYKACLQFISDHPEVMKEKETDGLLVEAFDAQLKGNNEYARLCVHQALLLQYCRTLGRDGVHIFFKRITTPGHQAQQVFLDDVENTYKRIKTRTAEINAERIANPTEDQVEQIQLQAVEPGTEIHFNIPQPNSTEQIEQQARAIFEAFPPGLQRALESGSLDKVNEVLGKMSVDEAEEIVGQLGESGMLDMRQGVIDSTTEEGQEELRKMKEEEQAKQAPVSTEPLIEKTEEVHISDPGI